MLSRPRWLRNGLKHKRHRILYQSCCMCNVWNRKPDCGPHLCSSAFEPLASARNGETLQARRCDVLFPWMERPQGEEALALHGQMTRYQAMGTTLECQQMLADSLASFAGSATPAFQTCPSWKFPVGGRRTSFRRRVSLTGRGRRSQANPREVREACKHE